VIAEAALTLLDDLDTRLAGDLAGDPS
jgi:hypothetical protein